ncbi:MAG: hypothetical protein UU03_C0002G0020 [Candidatus Woesebacteria bacterium GW2011_GWA1_40_45]|uniref:50S ribosomal protein L29 n=2 Tax=Candidatus Woeseibacteriota TaxID=1752722 RepID=A0A0G0SFP0_9BACT|nr:MAG: hypothetical protein UT72_C0009G0020 [Candidatus Woesebacteria bacterium GW2011_GWB1_40_101]KKR63584.1 MAG: hypothetical protein UU03_C0002G0020 [Candidatus Woesebacteria bacterium GW2011_GWA1_40_45]
MKKKELFNLRQKTAKELFDEIDKKRMSLIKERKNLKKARGLAKDIAQIATIIKEK